MSRLHPKRPIFSVSAIVFNHRHVLMIKRARTPWKNFLSLPGGAQKLGETVETALIREFAEETGLKIKLLKFFKLTNVIIKNTKGAIVHHYTIANFIAKSTGGKLKAGTDAVSVGWIKITSLKKQKTVPSLKNLIKAAWKDLDANKNNKINNSNK